jgi:O-methyltransferase
MLTAAKIAAWNVLHGTLARAGFGVATYRPPQRRGDFTFVRRVRAERESLTSPLEGMQILNAVRATAKLGGVMAEVGVFKGASARLIRAADPLRPLHLCDTFAGLPTPQDGDTVLQQGQLHEGDFACSLDAVQRYLSDLAGISYHVGRFPGSASPQLAAERFSFVHLDVDLYESSRASVAWFYERMVPGGILLSHDFASCPGPRRALTEFFATRPEPLIELPGDQALIVKLSTE